MKSEDYSVTKCDEPIVIEQRCYARDMDKIEIVKIVAWVQRGEPEIGEPVANDSLGNWGALGFVHNAIRYGLHLGANEVVVVKGVGKCT